MDVRLLPRRGLLLTSIAGIGVISALAGCGSSSTSSASGGGGATSSVTVNSSIASSVPAAVKTKGTLTVAADASYPPNESIGADGTTVVGMDADLANALGQVLGLKVSVVNATFDSILPGLASGKYDLGMSSFTDTKEREKTVDFVTYYNAGTSFIIKTGGPTINTVDDLCGHHVGVEKGTTQQDDATAQDTKCKSSNKAGVDVQVYTDQNGANTALVSGRVDVVMLDSPVAAYQVKVSNGQFALTGQSYGFAPYGIAIPKGNGMAQPILQSLQQLMQSGAYKQILDKYSIGSGAITNPQVNGATS